MRRLALRKAISVLVTVLAALVIGPVVGQFFIELAQEYGVYKNSSERLHATMSALSYFVGQSWVLPTGTLLVGAALGLWTDSFLRRWERKNADAATEYTPSIPAAPGGVLDYIVDGVQSLTDIANIQKGMTRDTRSISRSMGRYRLLISRISNHSVKRTLTSHFAGKLSTFAEKINIYAPRMRQAAENVENNCVPFVEVMSITTDDDITAFNQFRMMVNSMKDALRLNRTTIDETITSMQNFTGVSRDMNIAVSKLETSLGLVCGEIDTFIERLRRLEETCERKSNLLKVQT